MNASKLDNPAWHSLNETHRLFAIGNDVIKFYRPSICPFGGVNSKNPDFNSFFKKHNQLSSFFIIAELPPRSSQLVIEKELVCLQMVCPEPIKTEFSEDIVGLNETHKIQLRDLVNQVQPGYFAAETSLMGDYYGIFSSEKLVAVSGERMKMHGFTEISAVVTHPDYTGKGFAKQLVAFTANKNFEQNIIPYLHVANTNLNAIKLYQKLGFEILRKISFWKARRVKNE